MFNMSGSELLMVGLIALLVIPPDKIPKVAQSLGRLFAQITRNFQDIKDQVKVTFQDDLQKSKSPTRLKDHDQKPS